MESVEFEEIKSRALGMTRADRVRLIHTLVESLNDLAEPVQEIRLQVSTQIKATRASVAEISIGEAFRQLRAALEKEVVDNPIGRQQSKKKPAVAPEGSPRFPLAPGIE